MTDIPMNAEVICIDGQCGQSTEVIYNPVKRAISHFVVEDASLPDNTTRLVPVEKVESVTHSQIKLNCTRDEFTRMEPFITSRYIDPDEALFDDRIYWGADSFVDPLVINASPPNVIAEAHIPRDEFAVHRGMHVHATDGHVGSVDELVVDPEGILVTHILMRKGHLFGVKDVAIPITAVDDIFDDTIMLNVDKNTIKSYPTVPLHHHDDFE